MNQKFMIEAIQGFPIEFLQPADMTDEQFMQFKEAMYLPFNMRLCLLFLLIKLIDPSAIKANPVFKADKQFEIIKNSVTRLQKAMTDNNFIPDPTLEQIFPTLISNSNDIYFQVYLLLKDNLSLNSLTECNFEIYNLLSDINQKSMKNQMVEKGKLLLRENEIVLSELKKSITKILHIPPLPGKDVSRETSKLSIKAKEPEKETKIFKMNNDL